MQGSMFLAVLVDFAILNEGIVLMIPVATVECTLAIEKLWAGPAVRCELPLGNHYGSGPA